MAAPVSTGQLRREPARPQLQPFPQSIGCSMRRPGLRTLSAGSSATTSSRSCRRALKRCPTGISHPARHARRSRLSTTQTRSAEMTQQTDSKSVLRRYVQQSRPATSKQFAGCSPRTRRGRSTPDSYRYREPGQGATRSSRSSSPRHGLLPARFRQLEITGMIAERDHIVLQWTSRARTRDGRPYENGCIGVFTIREGRIERSASTWTPCMPARSHSRGTESFAYVHSRRLETEHDRTQVRDDLLRDDRWAARIDRRLAFRRATRWQVTTATLRGPRITATSSMPEPTGSGRT